MSGFEGGMAGPVVRTDPDHTDPGLRGRRYSIPYEAVWAGIVSTVKGISRCSVSEADDEAGVLRAEVTRRFPKAVYDLEIRIGLDIDAQTWVSMASVAREGRFDLGANERRVRGFFDSLDAAVGAEPGSILPPRMPEPPAAPPTAAEPSATRPTSNVDASTVGESPVGADRG